MNPLIAIPWNNRDYPWKEEHLQAAVVQMLFLMEDQKLLTFAADMNAGKRGFKAASMAKMTGMRAGEPDLRIYMRDAILLIELKREDGYISKEQKNRHNMLRSFGYNVIIVKAKTPQDAVNAVEDIINREMARTDNNY